LIAPSADTSSNTTGRGGARGRSSAAPTSKYRLDDADQIRIAPHVEQRVEITGAVVEESETAPVGTAGATYPRESTSETPASPKLKAQTIRVLSPSCVG
jgi:hypothetical protein